MLDSTLIEKISTNNPNQVVINLSCCDIDDAQMKALCEALTNNTHVHSLLVNWNKLTDIAVLQIAELLRKNHHIERMELAGNSAITEACIKELQSEFIDRFSNKQGLRRLALNPYYGARKVEEVCDLTPEAFITNYYKTKRPIVVRGAIKDSTAAKTWTPEYFMRILGDKEVPLSLWSPADCVNNQFYSLKKIKLTIQQMMTLFVDDDTVNSLTGRVYLQNHPLNEFTEIKEHILPPSFCNVINLNRFPPHLLCGQNDTLTQLHFDELDNIFLQIYGQKHITLFPPSDTRFLFQHKPDKNIWLRNVHRSRIPGTDLFDDYSTVHRYATPYHVHMHETDALFIPKHWWHEVRGLSGPSISVNYWFNTHPDYFPDVENLFSSDWGSSSIPAKKNNHMSGCRFTC